MYQDKDEVVALAEVAVEGEVTIVEDVDVGVGVARLWLLKLLMSNLKPNRSTLRLLEGVVKFVEANEVEAVEAVAVEGEVTIVEGVDVEFNLTWLPHLHKFLKQHNSVNFPV
jgi:hypothetical protein